MFSSIARDWIPPLLKNAAIWFRLFPMAANSRVMDIGMCCDDYEKFISIAPKELDNRFFLDNYETNKSNPLVFSKVRLKGTTYIENIGNKNLEHNEIFVDVFPYYYISDNITERKIEGLEMAFLAQAIMSKSGYKVWKGKGLKKRLKFLPTDGSCVADDDRFLCDFF